MNKLVLIALSTLVIGGECGGGNPDGGYSSQSCYIADMFRCNEEPLPTAAQQTNAPIACSSASGQFAAPAACPMANYQGRCTLQPASSGMDGLEIQRFYTGADVAYAADFCTNTVHGTWSTSF